MGEADSYRISRPGRFASAAQIACTYRRARVFAPLLCPVAQMLPSPTNKTALAYESAARSGLDSCNNFNLNCNNFNLN